MPKPTQRDPSVIGGVAEAVFAYAPDPAHVFTARAERLAFLSGSSNLADYLRFLAALTGVQARLVADLPRVSQAPPDRIDLAREARMPPLDRAALVDDPLLDETLTRLCAKAASIDMPEPARLALQAVTAAGPADRAWLLGNILADTIPPDAIAPHLFAAAAVQVHMARLAATLDPALLVPIGTGLCPACGGRPVTSSVVTQGGLENLRYATCASCATQWNEVRVKCLSCGSTKGISYRSVETDEATVKAECCTECRSWLKILWHSRNPSIDPVADDVGSLGLDLMMRDTPFRRAGFDPWLAGF